jgi:hypothetical protein
MKGGSSDMAAKAVDDKVRTRKPREAEAVTCGLIMPISALDGCSVEHWTEVKSILVEAVEGIDAPEFTVRLVSDDDAVGIIQKRIVQNVYTSDIVVCDVSGKNPNVMFELGMRLAFDKPTVIVKDEKTDYSFDTGIIEHVTYPRDLRFTKIVEFKRLLAEKVLSTYQVASSNPEHSTFLKSFGKFQVASLSETEVTPDKMMINMLEELQTDMHRLRRLVDVDPATPEHRRRNPELYGRMARCIQQFRRKSGIKDVASLIGDERFYGFAEMELDAPEYYTGPSAFKRDLDAVLRGLAAKDRQRLLLDDSPVVEPEPELVAMGN